MSDDYDWKKKNELTEKDIVLGLINEIVKLSTSREYRGGFTEVKDLGSREVEVYIEDSRKKIIQGVEMLEILLSERFAKDTSVYQGILTAMQENLKEFDDGKIELEVYITKKLNLSLSLLRALIKLLHQSKWLARAIIAG